MTRASLRSRLAASTTGALVLFILAAYFVSVADASYQLTRGKRCKAEYVKQVRHIRRNGRSVGQVWCIHETATGPNTDSYESGHISLSTGVYGGKGELRGLPIKYTIIDSTTLTTVATFSGVSNLYGGCGIHWSIPPGGPQVIEGAAFNQYAACPLAPVSVPQFDLLGVTAAFAGNSQYAASHGEAAL